MAAQPLEVRLERASVALEDHARRLQELEGARPAVLASELVQVRGEIEQIRKDIAALRGQCDREFREVRDHTTAELKDVREELKANRRGLWAVALAVLGGAVSFAFTALTIWGGSS
jgi:predicted  nucleic acid-binding Zn-ribbon protein